LDEADNKTIDGHEESYEKDAAIVLWSICLVNGGKKTGDCTKSHKTL
jgi:hypothetical protein